MSLSLIFGSNIMKSLNLGLTTSVGFNISAEAFAHAEPGKPVTLNLLDVDAKAAIDAEYQQARMNAAEVITATIQLEHKVTHFIGNVLCGPVHAGINGLLKQRNFLGQLFLSQSTYHSIRVERC
jgi:hypothetical protein